MRKISNKFRVTSCKDTIKRVKYKRKTRFLLYFRAGVPWTDRSKVGISERKAKEKLKFSLLVSSQQSCRDISPFTLLRSKAMLTLFVLKDVVQVGHDGLQVFPNLSVIQFIDVFGCQGG